MLSVAIHKDMLEYQPKIIGKLTARTLVCIVGAVGVSVFVGLYMYFVLGMEVADNMVFIYAVSLPFWLCGFWQPKGMPFEKFLPLWLKADFGNGHLFYVPTVMKMETAADAPDKKKKGNVYDKKYRKFLSRTRGIEAYSPRAGRVIV